MTRCRGWKPESLEGRPTRGARRGSGNFRACRRKSVLLRHASTRFAILASLLAVAILVHEASAESDPLAEATLVVFNNIDPLSEDLANYYASKRGIPKDQVVGIACPMAEDITRLQYDQVIAEPLRKLFLERGWWKMEPGPPPKVVDNRIRFVALIRGIPLRIAPVAEYPGEIPRGPEPLRSRNEAAVDSELAVLGPRTHTISGALVNPYFRSFRRIIDNPVPGLMLVCRLDGPTGEQVKRIIDDSITAEKTGLWGFAYIDVRNITTEGLVEGDNWLRAAAKAATENGIPVVMGHGEKLFPQTYPMTHAAFYYGWYAQDVSGPFVREDFRFVPGAVAAHIHSFSASSVRSPRQWWVGPLLMAGAAATFGNVFEPYLGLTTQPGIFQERLQDGFTFAESAYMATNALSWMSTFVGDPLYQPFKLFRDTSREPEDGEWLAYRNGARAWFTDGREVGEARLRRSGNSLRSGVIFEGLASLLAGANDLNDALEASQTARRYYRDPADIIRVTYREANMLTGMGRKRDALKLLDEAIRKYRDDPAMPCLKELRDELDPPPPPPPQPPPPGPIQ